MIIKVCGMREPENIAEVSRLKIQMMGFIFYSGSSRCVKGLLPHTPDGIERVGVFVNESMENILQTAVAQHLTCIQLHGQESAEACRQIRSAGYKVFKAFPIDSDSDFRSTLPYQECCDLFVFDTKSSAHGGSGVHFDWNILCKYTGATPFLLSGGIGPADVESIHGFSHPKMIGVDLNSRFEIEPALKNIPILQTFIQHLYETH